MTRGLIFDFDGVLADSFQPLYSLIRAGFQSVGLSLTENQYRDLFCDNVHAGYKALITDPKKYEDFIAFRKNHFAKYYAKAKLFPAVPDFLSTIKDSYFLAVVSSGQSESITSLLKTSGLLTYFSMIEAAQESSKRLMIEKIINSSGLAPSQFALVSDTSGDLTLSKSLGLKTIGVTWGFHGPDILAAVAPDHLVGSFEALRLILLTQ